MASRKGFTVVPGLTQPQRKAAEQWLQANILGVATCEGEAAADVAFNAIYADRCQRALKAAEIPVDLVRWFGGLHDWASELVLALRAPEVVLEAMQTCRRHKEPGRPSTSSRSPAEILDLIAEGIEDQQRLAGEVAADDPFSWGADVDGASAADKIPTAKQKTRRRKRALDDRAKRDQLVDKERGDRQAAKVAGSGVLGLIPVLSAEFADGSTLLTAHLPKRS